MAKHEATWLQWLTEAGADFARLRFVYSPKNDHYDYSEGTEFLPAFEIEWDHPILATPFDTGYGSADAPSIVAWDERWIYFPVQYDGATWCDKVLRDPARYVGSTELPYPGGG